MRKVLLSIVLAAFTAFAIAGGLAVASIPDGNGVVHGCYAPGASGQSGGALSVIDSAGQSCATGATPLNWDASPVMASGDAQQTGTGHSPCTFSSALTYCTDSSLSFTASRDATCKVSEDIAFYPGAAGVEWGIGEKVNGTNSASTDQSVISTAGVNAQVARSIVTSVVSGSTYIFEPWVSSGVSGNTAYWNLDYICF